MSTGLGEQRAGTRQSHYLSLAGEIATNEPGAVISGHAFASEPAGIGFAGISLDDAQTGISFWTEAPGSIAQQAVFEVDLTVTLSSGDTMTISQPLIVY